MLISHGKKFIFLKTAKTAGTSVEIYLEPYCRNEGRDPAGATPEHVSEAGVVGYRGPDPTGSVFYNHAPARIIQEAVGPTIWSSYTKITCIRNPFDKVISYFWFINKRGLLAGLPSAVNLSTSVDDTISAFRLFVNAGGLPIDAAIFTLDGTPCCDIYIRYEALLPDLEATCARLDIPFEPERLGYFKAGNRLKDIPISDYYDISTADRVRSVFANEFEWFGYDRLI